MKTSEDLVGKLVVIVTTEQLTFDKEEAENDQGEAIQGAWNDVSNEDNIISGKCTYIDESEIVVEAESRGNVFTHFINRSQIIRMMHKARTDEAKKKDKERSKRIKKAKEKKKKKVKDDE